MISGGPSGMFQRSSRRVAKKMKYSESVRKPVEMLEKEIGE